MISKKDLQVGDYVHLGIGAERHPHPLTVAGVLGDIYLDSDCEEDGVFVVEEEEVSPVLISPEILEKNGWVYIEGIWALKSKPRLGWYPKTAQLIIDFRTFYMEIKYVHQLQHMMRLIGIDEIKL